MTEKGHKYRDWLGFGMSTEKKLKRMGGASGGGTQPPRRKRRTPPHQKGVAYPGNFAANNPPAKSGRR